MDRYDELMLGLYQGFVPRWLPGPSRVLFERESLRRRCDLGQLLSTRFPCTTYCGQALIDEDFAERVYAAWPATRFSARNVVTGLFLALNEVLNGIDGALAIRELLQYEAMAIPDLTCAPSAARVDEATSRAAGIEGAEVYRFVHAVPELHARMTLYAGARAPASFARSYTIVRREAFVARAPAPDGRGFVVTDVTPYLPPVGVDDAPAHH